MQVYTVGRFKALNELHELIHYIVDESPLIKLKTDLFIPCL